MNDKQVNDIRAIPNEDLKVLANQAFGLAYRILGHRDDAADAVQDSMHQLYRKQDSFDSHLGTLKSWFLKIVRNRCIDMQRKKRPTTGVETFDPIDRANETPEQISERDELVAGVNAALQEMPAEAREIILLRDFHGFSYAEISDVLGIASGTVMSRLHRARQLLRKKVISAKT